MPPHDPNRRNLERLGQPPRDDLRIHHHRHRSDDADDAGDIGHGGGGGGWESGRGKGKWEQDTRGPRRETGGSRDGEGGDRDGTGREGRTRAPER